MGTCKPLENIDNKYFYFLVICLAFISNFASLYGDFIFDDTEAIINNKDVLPVTNLTSIFLNDFWGTSLKHNLSHKSYRPLTIITYRWNYVLSGGFTPWSFHLVNLFLHIFICCLTIPVSNRILFGYGVEAREVAIKAACLFAVHPVHTEAVCGIVGRADLLASLFFVLSFLTYSNKHYHVNPGIDIGLSIVLAGVAMLCKEYGITVMGLNLIYEIIVFQQLNPRRIFEKNSIKYQTLKNCLCLVVSTVFLLLLRGFIMDFKNPEFQVHDNPASFHENVYARVFSLSYLTVLNFWILLCPYWLCYDWSMGCVQLITSVVDFRVVIVLIFWVFIISLSFRSLFNKNINVQRTILLALSLLIVPYLPASNLFFRVGFVIAERILYLPSMGFCLLISIGFQRATNYFQKVNISIWSVPRQIVCVLVCMFMLRSHIRTLDWRSEYSLFNSALTVCPNNAKVHYNIAKNAADKGKNDVAIEEYQEAIRLHPNYDQALNNLANLLKTRGDLLQAESLLKKAIKIRFDFPAAWMNLGIVLSNLKKFAEAEKSYLIALKLRKHYPDCYYNLGNLYLEEERWQEAEEAWLMATKLKPQMVIAWSNLIMLNDNLGRYSRAVSLADQALNNTLGKVPSIYFNMAGALGKLNQFELAEKYFKMAIECDPKNALYHVNLGVLYHRTKNYTSAKKYYFNALRIDPQLISARKNMNMLLKVIREKQND